MANVNAPFGLRPVRHLNGSPWNGQTIRCYLHGSYAVAMFVGDPVQYQTELNYKDTTGKHPSIMLCAGSTTTTVFGVITSFEPDPDNLSLQYNPASNERYANVCLAGDVIFQIQDDGAGAPTAVFVGQNTTMTAGSRTGTIDGLSAYVLDSTTPTTTQAHPLHILRVSDIEDNTLGDYCIYDVIISTPSDATGRWLGVTAT